MDLHLVRMCRICEQTENLQNMLFPPNEHHLKQYLFFADVGRKSHNFLLVSALSPRLSLL